MYDTSKITQNILSYTMSFAIRLLATNENALSLSTFSRFTPFKVASSHSLQFAIHDAVFVHVHDALQ